MLITMLEEGYQTKILQYFLDKTFFPETIFLVGSLHWKKRVKVGEGGGPKTGRSNLKPVNKIFPAFRKGGGGSNPSPWNIFVNL